MIVYTYDGSFEGFLTCIYEGYYNELKPEDITRQNFYEPTFLTEEVFIPTDIEKSEKVYKAIRTKLTKISAERIFHVYLAETKGSEILIFNYIKLCFKIGKDVDLYLHLDIVSQMLALERRVTWEAARMLGFIRFEAIANNLYYSPIEPDHNILSLIGDHFSQRLQNQNWIIHDVSREAACIYNKKNWILVPLSKEDGKILVSNNNLYFYENLWSDYFQSIAITERKNEKCQKGHMPARYWKNLTEFKFGSNKK